MIELESMERVEQKETPLETVKGTLLNLETTGQLENISREVLKAGLTEWGANFENLTSEGEESLGKYKRGNKRKGINEVWGESFYDQYEQWTEEWGDKFESNSDNRRLPGLSKSGKKNAGMIQMLGELTAYAAGQLEFEDLNKHLETRVYNGKAWQEERQRKKIKVPTKSVPIRVASIPPGFIPKFVDHMEATT